METPIFTYLYTVYILGGGFTFLEYFQPLLGEMIQFDGHIQLPTSYINIYQLQKIQTGPSIDWQPVLGNPPEKFQPWWLDLSL